MAVVVEHLIEQLALQPHPEGGYYRETYRAAGTIPKTVLGDNFSGNAQYSTAIYYLLKAGQKSRLHKIASDEVWHFYAGDPMVVVELNDDGLFCETVIGADFEDNQRFQHVVPAGHWFGAYPLGKFSLVGCTVAPGFNFDDLIFLTDDYKETLLKKYFNQDSDYQRDIINKLMS